MAKAKAVKAERQLLCSVGTEYLHGPADRIEGIYTRYSGEDLEVSIVCYGGRRVRLKVTPQVAARVGSRLVVRAAERIR